MTVDPLQQQLQLSLGSAYTLERELGGGGMSRVFVAREEALGRDVVVKVLAPELAEGLSAERFAREVRLAARLQHPNIVPVLGAGAAADGLPYYTMPFIAGASLRERLVDGSLPVPEAIAVMRDVARALAYAHAQGVVHRDVKPANVLLTGGAAVVTDFGVAKALHSAGAPGTLTQAGMAVGTPAYMAPEQAAGDAEVDHRADLYAWGLVAWEALAGWHPFADKTSALALIGAHLTQEPPALASVRPEVPPALAALVARCLQKDPAERPSNALAVLRALDAVSPTWSTPARAALPMGDEGRHPGSGDFGDGLSPLPSGVRASGTPSPSSERSLVVLPFANLSPDPDTDYFADGLTDEVTTDLSRVNALTVVSRASAMRLKGTEKDLRTLGRELGVRFAVAGSVRKAGKDLRISAALADTASEVELWAEKFAGTTDDVFDIQERVSRAIVLALSVRLSPEEERRMAQRPIGDPRAYDCYLRAHHKIVRFSAPDLDDALTLLGEGLRILGENELLLGTMGQAYLYYVHWGVRPEPRYLDDAERCARAIFRINPASAQGHAVFGGLLMKRGQVQDAVSHLRRAVEADPSHLDALTWLVYCYLTAGRAEAARPLIDRLLDVDPLNAINHAARGWQRMTEGRVHDALLHYERGYELDPAAPLMRWLHGWSLAQAGHRGQAVRELAAFADEARGTVFGAVADALRHGLTGDSGASLAAVSPLLETAAEHDEALAQFLSEIHALAGAHDTALRWLDRAVGRGYLNYPILAEVDALYGDLRRDTRFHLLMGDVRRRWEAFVS